MNSVQCSYIHVAQCSVRTRRDWKTLFYLSYLSIVGESFVASSLRKLPILWNDAHFGWREFYWLVIRTDQLIAQHLDGTFIRLTLHKSSVILDIIIING